MTAPGLHKSSFGADTPNAVHEVKRGSLHMAAESFYWALLDANVVKGARIRNTRQLDYLFETVIPLPVEQLQTAYLKLQPARDGKLNYVACGMERERIRRELDQHGDPPLVLRPAQVPEFIAAAVGEQVAKAELDQLNMLLGELEPKLLRTFRKRWRVQLAVLCGLCAFVITVGMERHAQHASAQAAQWELTRTQLIQQVLPTGTVASSRQPPELQLLAELRRLRQTRRQPRSELALVDVSHDLAILLARWPHPDMHIQTESISITPTAMTIRAVAPQSSNIQQLADSVSGLSESSTWRLTQPQISTARDAVQGTIQLRRAASASSKLQEPTGT